MAITDGLLHHWTLDEPSGLRLDDVSGLNVATIVGVDGGVAEGHIGSPLFLDQPGGGLEAVHTATSASVAGLAEVSYSFWLLVETFTNGFTIFATGQVPPDGRLLRAGVNSDARLGFNITISTPSEVTVNTVNPEVVLGEWQHWVYTWNTSGEFDIYLNGVLNTENSIPANTIRTLTTTEITAFGQDVDLADGTNHRSRVDEFSIWNRAITPAEVLEVYNSGVGITLQSPVLTLLETYAARDLVYRNYPGVDCLVKGADAFELYDKRTEVQAGRKLLRTEQAGLKSRLNYRQLRPYIDQAGDVLPILPSV